MLRSYVARGYQVDVFHYRFPHEEDLPAQLAGTLNRYTTISLEGSRYRRQATLLPSVAWQCRRAYAGSGIMPGSYDVVQAETSTTWTVARSVPARSRLLVLHDDDSDRLRGLAKTAPDQTHRAVAELTARKYARWQRISLREADQVWFASSIELERLASTLPRGKARLIPNGAGDELWSVPIADEPDGKEVLFIAPGFYDANSFGLAWFLREAWPIVRQRVPGAHLRVVGVGWDGFGSVPGRVFRRVA